ncbi:MAG: hypothetical protein KIS67_01370 [Verrucomicrobiae bacterium]|nr:hypothetical protein [Verrucomicrobiae bacterium]
MNLDVAAARQRAAIPIPSQYAALCRHAATVQRPEVRPKLEAEAPHEASGPSGRRF